MILRLRIWLQKFIKNGHFLTKNESSMTQRFLLELINPENEPRNYKPQSTHCKPQSNETQSLRVVHMTLIGDSVLKASFMRMKCIMNYWSFTLLSVVKSKTDCQQSQLPLHVPAASLFSVWSYLLSILVTTTPDV